MCKLGECYDKLVREFLVNIPKDCDNPLRRDYKKVYVIGECVNFSPNIINNFLGAEGGAVEVEATDNQIRKEIIANNVRVWPKKGKFSSEKLSVKYAVLNRIGAANWVPTTHFSDIATGLARFIFAIGTKTKMDIGRYVFDQTMRHAKTNAVKLPIVFLTLLCKIILSQHPNIISAADLPMKRGSPITFHQKLFGDSHAPDLVGTSVPTLNASNMSEEEVICQRTFVADNAVEEADSEKEVEDKDGSGDEGEDASDSNGDLAKEGEEEESESSSEAEE